MPFDISRFKSTLDKYGGPARTSLFEVTITNSEPNSKMNSRDLTFFCTNVQLPGLQIETNSFTAVGQRPTFFPSTLPGGSLNAAFMVDSDHQILSFFHNWMQKVLNFSSGSGPLGAIGSGPGDYQLPYELGYKDEYSCPVSIKHHSVSSTGSKYYEVKLDKVFPTVISDVDLSWEGSNQFMLLPVTFSYDKISYSSDRTGRQTRNNGRGLLETLGDLAGFADVVRQTVNQGRPQSIQDAVNRLNRVRNSYDNLTNFFEGD